MASIAVVPVEMAVEAVVETAVETAVEGAVEAAVEGAVEGAVEDAVETAVEKEVEDSVGHSVESAVEKIVVQDVQDAVMSSLKKAFNGFSDGVQEAIRSAVDNTTQAVMDEIMKVLQQDVAKMLSGLNLEALEKLQRLRLRLSHDEPNEPATEEECCGFLDEIDGIGSALGEEEEEIDVCMYLVSEIVDGVERFTDFACLKASDVDALKASPILGSVVKSLLSVFQEEEEDIPEGLLGGKGVPSKKGLNLNSTVVRVGNKRLYNVDGSAMDHRKSSWVRWWQKMVKDAGNPKIDCDKCFCRISKPGDHTNPQLGNMVGGHMELASEKAPVKDWYMLPICKAHNAKIYDRDRTDGPMTAKPDAWAVKFKVHPNYMLAQAEPREVALRETAEKPTEKPFGQRIVTEFAGQVLKKELPQQIKALLDAIQSAVKSAGDDAKQFTKHEGSRITKISLIPFYGWVKGPIELSHMKQKCLDHFDTVKNQKVTAAVQGFTVDSNGIQAATEEVVNSADWKALLESAEQPSSAARA